MSACSTIVCKGGFKALPARDKYNKAMNYGDRIARALQFIRENLNRPLSLDEIAQESHFSSYHFHRIFHASTGETVHECTNRLRLEQTVHLLRFRTDLSITEIAHATGFSSSANFSKAFKAYFGVTPRQIRKPNSIKNSKIGKLQRKYGKEFEPQKLYPTPMMKNVHVDIRQLSQQSVCSLSSVGGYTESALLTTWDKLIVWSENNGIPSEQQQRFALCYDNPIITPLSKCRYDALLIIDPTIIVRSPFKRAIIPEGQYAVMAYQGSPDNTSEAIMSFYSNWLPESGFVPDHFPLMEHYLNDMRQDGFAEIEFFIKLREISSTS